VRHQQSVEHSEIAQHRNACDERPARCSVASASRAARVDAIVWQMTSWFVETCSCHLPTGAPSSPGTRVGSQHSVTTPAKPLPRHVRSVLRRASSPRNVSQFAAGGLPKKRMPRAISLASVQCLLRPADEPDEHDGNRDGYISTR
jgi:hypothetical protein